METGTREEGNRGQNDNSNPRPQREITINEGTGPRVPQDSK